MLIYSSFRCCIPVSDRSNYLCESVTGVHAGDLGHFYGSRAAKMWLPGKPVLVCLPVLPGCWCVYYLPGWP
eukprot:scaffold4849_cov153-Amphora_coffeaeformis.AAC.3